MPDLPVADVDREPRQVRLAKPPYRVLYDRQCEICQGCVSWLKTLDRAHRTTCLPISPEVLASVDSRLGMDDCLRQLHVVTPEGAILMGWDAVACLRVCSPPLGDVDSRKWLVSLDRMMALEIEILVEGHGHIHTLRPDIPDFPGVVIREDPKVAIAQKRDYLRWLREQIEAGFQRKAPRASHRGKLFSLGKPYLMGELRH